MGQALGRAPVLPGARNFSNLPKSKIFELWGAFHEEAEGFGLTQDEFLSILRRCLSSHLEFSVKKLDQIGKVVFTTLDDDANDLIDALEFLASFAVMSGMTRTEKAQFVFGMFDFDECGVLSPDEIAFALRTTISGLCKLSAMDPPLESEIDGVALQATISRKSNKIKGHGKQADSVSLDDFITFCDTCPEVSSWICCFGDLDEFGVSTLKLEETDEKCVQLVAHAGRHLHRTGRAFAAMDLDAGGGGVMGIENRGLAKDICAQSPWRADVVPYTEPTDCPVAIPESPPDIQLHLEWVYGMNTKQSKGSLSYTGGGDLVYPAGCLGVVFDLETGNQRYLNSHTDTITCLKVYIEANDSIHKTAQEEHSSSSSSSNVDHAPKTLIVSGEAGKIPKVIVWSPGSRFEEPRVISTLKGFHQDGISQVAWSPDGSLIATVGASGMHSVAVYDWHRRALVFAAPSSEPAVLGTTWASNHQFVTCGYNHINFWTCELALQDPVLYAKKLAQKEMHFNKERGLFGKKSLNMPLLCVGGFGDLVVTGGATGHLAVWDGRNCIRQAKGHSGAMTCLHVLHEQGAKPRGLVTGGSDGTIQLWNHQLELGLRFDGVNLLHPASSTIHSVVWDDFNHKVLVCFWSCEVFEVHDSEGYDIHNGPLVLGHHSHRAFGLTTNPYNANEVATCGEDKTVRIWDSEKRHIKSSVTLDTMAHCVCFDPTGELLAVGLGYQTKPSAGFGQGAVPQRKDGSYLILKRTYGEQSEETEQTDARYSESMMVIHEGRDSKQPITCCCFSPDSRVLAMGSADGNIYLYGKLSLGGWGPTATCRGFIGVLTHIDFSLDSSLLQSCDSSGLLLFFEAQGNRVGEEVKKSSDSDSLWSSLKDVKWSNPSSVYGWGVQGCWGAFDDGTEVLCTSRTHERASGAVVASVDNFSRVRLWRYPCASASPACAEYRGHGGGGISSCAFSKDDSKFFTIGQEDCCLIQWRVKYGGGVPINEACSEDSLVGTSEIDLKDTDAFERFEDANASNIDDKTKLFFMEERAADEDMSEVQPWQKSALPPSRPPPERVDEPTSALRLYWMYGFRALDCRQQVKYARPWGLPASTILEQAAARGGHDNLVCFFGGAVSAILDASNNSMTFHRDHTDEVTCIGVHPSRSICATGQQGKYPFICVWDYRGTLTSRGAAPNTQGVPRQTKETLVSLHGSHRTGIRHICFSDCGKYLASISLDNWHTLVVHDWENSHVVCTRETCRETPLDLAFIPQIIPTQRELAKAGVTETPKIELVMVGVNTIKFITITEGHNSEAKSASLGSEGMWQTFLCVGFLGVEPGSSQVQADSSISSPINKPRLSAMRTVVGCQDGSLYLLAGTKLTQTFSAHSGPVNVVSCHAEGLASGGHDGLIKVWKYADKTGLLTCTLVVDVAHYGSVLPVIRSLQFDHSTNRLLVGTLGAEIFELSARDGASTVVGGGPLLQGHAHTDAQTEVHGVAAHPSQARFATTGDDATLRIWDADNCSIIAMTALESPSRCCCFDPRGERLAIGFGSPIKKKAKQADGKFVIMGVGDFGILFEGVTQGQRYLTDVKWSPSGSVVAFASADSRIYLFNADDGFALKASCVAHDFPIRSMDFSANSSFLLSNCSGGCLNFFDADTGHLINEPAKIRDQKWSSCTASMQWSTAGCWPPQRDGTDVMCCDATGPQFDSNIPNGPAILATGDNFGRLKLFRYPCDSSLTHHKLYRAHGSAGPPPIASKGKPPRPQPAPLPCTLGEGWSGLSKIKWVGQGKWLISVAAKEKVMMQWLHEYDVDGDDDASQAEKYHCNSEERLAALGVEDAESEVLEGMLAAQETAAASLNPDTSSKHSKKSSKHSKKHAASPSSNLSVLSALSGEEEEGPAKPWLTALVEPSDPESYGNPMAMPSISGTTLERCFGVAMTVPGASKQANIGYSGGQEGNLAIWGSASFGVVYDKKAHTQSIYRGHGGSPLGCISISPNGRYVATGETSKDRPLVKLWDAATCCELATLGPYHRRSIACLAWSHDCKKVVSVGGDMDHSICVWGTDSGLWEDATKIVDDSPRPSATSRPLASKLACGSGGPLPVYFACFLDQTCWGPGGLYNHANSVHDSASASSTEGVGSRHPGYLFATGGVDHMMLWSLEGRTLSNERGLWGVGKKVQPMLCGNAAGRRLISGALSGHLYSWLGRRCEKMVKAHRGAVSSVWTATFSDGIEGRVVSGGMDGCVNVYDGRLQPLCRFDLLNDAVNGKCDVPPLLPIIRGVGGAIAFGGNLGQDIPPNVDVSKTAVLPTGEFVNRVIVSTASAEIYELSPDSGSWTLLAEGHYTDPNTDGSHAQLWGLAAHPTQADLVATCGDDGIVSVWSLGLGRMLRKAQLDSAARCVAWSPDGTLLLVGMGGSAVPGRGRQSKDGCLVLLNSATLEVLLEARDAQHWLRACSFSPAGETFAVCSQDGSIYLYDTRGRTLRAKCAGFSDGPAMSLDFSVDGAYIQCDGGAGKGYEHLYFSGGDGMAFSLPSQLKNVKWATWTCRLGWPMTGAWPQTKGGYDRNLAEPTTCDRTKKGDLLAVGYEDGRVRIFRYPCLNKAAPNVSMIAHAGPVALLRFSCDGKYLLSIGREDRALLAWKLVKKATGETTLLAQTGASSPDIDVSSGISKTSSHATSAQTANGWIGTNVVLHGMVDNPDLNGCEGLVLDYRTHPSRRYTVKIEGESSGRVVMIKPGHMRKVPEVTKSSKSRGSRKSQYK